MVVQDESAILWIDDDQDVLHSAERMVRARGWRFCGVGDADSAAVQLKTEKFSVVVADYRLKMTSGLDFLEHCRNEFPSVTRVLVTGLLEVELLERAVNRASVFRFIAKPWEQNQVCFELEKAIEHHRLQLSQNVLKKEVSTQNRRLEELTSGLESLVVERTRDSELSRKEVELKVLRLRELVRFIKDLSLTKSLDELLNLLHREFRRYHELRSPILAYIRIDRKPGLAYFQGRQAVDRPANSVWTESQRIRQNDLADQKYLATEFARPFAKVLAIPLKKRLGVDNGQEIPATLFFEHNLNDNQVLELIGSLTERIQPVSLAIDRILLEYHLRLSSLQWESTFDGIKDPIAIVDIDYGVVRANRQFHQKSYAHECFRQFAQESSVCRGCPVEKALQTSEPHRGQIKRGTQVFDVFSYPIKLSGDMRTTNVINHYVEVTGERDLYSRVIQSEKMAAIGLLAGSIAHELNNPLTGIRSLAQVLLQEIDAEKALHADLVEVEKAAERCQKIIENLLNFSKSKGDADSVLVSVNQVVSNTLPMLKTAMREHRCEINLSEQDLFAKAPPQLLQQVIFNLVNNACQAMIDPGTISISTNASRSQGSDSQKDWIEIHVKDTGQGIPPEILETIFEPFFTTKDPGQGTGLGLSMSLSIIKKLGGQILVESVVGKGSHFIVQLPLAMGGCE